MKSEAFGWSGLLVQLCVLAFVAYFARYNGKLRAHAEDLAGELVLKALRPRVKRWWTVPFALAWSAILGQGAMCAYFATFCRPFPTMDFLNSLASAFLMFFVLTIDSFAVCPYLEFREHGILSGAIYWPWESIPGWTWVDQRLTLRLRFRNAIMNYRLTAADTEAVQRVLEDHLAERGVAS